MNPVRNLTGMDLLMKINAVVKIGFVLEVDDLRSF